MRLAERIAVCYYKHKMNPQDPQQPYGQPAYTPPNPNQAPQPNQTGGYAVVPPPTPIPGQGNGGHNPYEFIMSPTATNGKTSGGSAFKRVLAIVGFLVVLTIIGTLVASFLIPKDTSGPHMIAVAQEQQELVRVAGEVAQGANSSELRNFAMTTQMSVDTNRQATVRYMIDRKIEVDDKTLALKQDAATDKNFKVAQSTNTFDSIAAQTLNTQLVTYQENLKKAYNTVPGKKARAILQASYDAASALVTQGATVSN